MSASILDILLLTPGPRGRMGLPAILWSSPGVGKTSAIEQASAKHGLKLETVILSVREPADVAGLPVVMPDGVRLEPPAWAKRLDAQKTGIVFLDEISTGSPTLQAAALRVVCEGVVGDLPLPPGVRILAASNPEDESAGGFGLTAPLANRLIHIDFDTPTAEVWASWLSGDGKPDQSAPPVMAPAVWEKTWAAARTSFAAFIRRFPEHLLSVPKTETQRGRAWPSPRSCELAARAWAGAKALGATDGTILRLLIGAIGDGVAKAAFTYLRELDLPDPELILLGQAEVPMKRPDQTYASLGGVCAIAVIDHPQKPERVTRAFEVAAQVSHKHADVALACLKGVCRKGDLENIFKDIGKTRRLSVALNGPLKQLEQVLGASV